MVPCKAQPRDPLPEQGGCRGVTAFLGSVPIPFPGSFPPRVWALGTGPAPQRGEGLLVSPRSPPLALTFGCHPQSGGHLSPHRDTSQTRLGGHSHLLSRMSSPHRAHLSALMGKIWILLHLPYPRPPWSLPGYHWRWVPIPISCSPPPCPPQEPSHMAMVKNLDPSSSSPPQTPVVFAWGLLEVGLHVLWSPILIPPRH